MNPLVISLLAFALIVGGALCGLLIRPSIPERHLSGASQDVIKLAMGLIATMTALVLGLLIAAANSSYQVKRTQINQITAQLIYVDHLLEGYGTETRQIREGLRQALGSFVARIWREENTSAATTGSPFVASFDAEILYRNIHLLSPTNDLQRSLRDEILTVITSLSELRLQLFAEAASPIPRPFVAFVIFWLIIIFLSFGFLAPPNATMLTVLFISAASASAALFLILEMSQPFTGLMAIPATPLLNALGPI